MCFDLGALGEHQSTGTSKPWEAKGLYCRTCFFLHICWVDLLLREGHKSGRSNMIMMPLYERRMIFWR